MARTNAQPSQKFVDVESIRDGFVLLKGGGIRAALLASSINLSLKSIDEQEATIMQFQNFLNSLDFSVQLLVQSRKLDIRPYLLTLEERMQQQTEELLQIQIREYIEFIKNFTEVVNVMDKKFYVIVPYDSVLGTSSKSGGIMSSVSGLFGGKKTSNQSEQEKNESFEEKRSQIEQRMAIVSSGLSRIGVRTEMLGTEEMIELLYSTYNPGDVRQSTGVVRGS